MTYYQYKKKKKHILMDLPKASEVTRAENTLSEQTLTY